MSIYTTKKFASVIETGTDWRDTSKKVLEKLELVRTDEDKFNVGFLYISDDLVDNSENILNLFESVTGIEHWVGSIGLGVCGVGKGYFNQPAISAMIASFDKNEFRLFPAINLDLTKATSALAEWLDMNEAALSLVHGNPYSDTDPMHIIKQIETLTESYVFGGLSSSRSEHVQFSRGLANQGVSGIVFDQSVPLMTTVSQGCVPVGPVHVITRCEDNIIQELDGRRAFDVFSEDLKSLAKSSTEKEFKNVAVDFDYSGENTEEPNDFRGEVHVAFPITGSDQGDYLVRNAIGIDPDSGWIAVAKPCHNGEHMMFVHRDTKTVNADLSKTLLNLRSRVKDECGDFDPKGAIYISCAARTASEFNVSISEEVKLVQEILGDVPLAGFYANGEISNCRIYGYTAVLLLFL